MIYMTKLDGINVNPVFPAVLSLETKGLIERLEMK